ncbi:MAG: hypothetical protein NTU87_00255, partial [Verrucomicrobia bacterium]|nr:hypothetical protein [Verrucomicrobiota bacterium]
MQELKKIWAFGIPYLKPYRFRFVLGIALSIFFGVSNGLFVLSINTLFNRLTPTPAQTPPVTQIESTPATETVSFDKKIKATLKNKTAAIGKSFQAASDEWLPRMGQKITWKQMLGGFSLLPLVMGLRAMASYFSTYCLTWV